MTKATTRLLLALGVLLSAAASAGENSSTAPAFAHPLDSLEFRPDLEQQLFERSTLAALQVSDPLERFNRRMYHFNYRFDQFVFLPVVDGYRRLTPRPIRRGISNFFANLGEVPTLANSLLQLKGQRAMHSTARLLFNSILGVGGLWDPASKMGLPRVKEDFGQTLGHYGVPPGPYLMLPLLGPSSLRDGGGLVADFSLQQRVNWLHYNSASQTEPALHLLEAVDSRYGTDMAYGQLNSPFEYEKIRYIYIKARELQIRD